MFAGTPHPKLIQLPRFFPFSRLQPREYTDFVAPGLRGVDELVIYCNDAELWEMFRGAGPTNR